MSLANSPFQKKLGTNYIPSDPELKQLRSLLVDPTDELAQINVLIDQLIAKPTSLKAEIDAHVALMSPIRRVPTVVLQEIFAACLPTAHNALIDPHEAPMLLGRICSRWRSVAYSTPNIWSSLHIPTLEGGYIPAGIEEKFEKSIQAWLARSAAYPLSISLSTFPLYPSHRIVDLVVKVSLRVRHLSLSTRPLLLGAEDFPCPESIEIRGAAGSAFLEDPPSVADTQSSHKVSLELTADVSALSLRWSQLTDVDIGFYEPNDPHSTSHSTSYQNAALEMLRMCRNLARCRIRTNGYVPFEPSPVFTLSYLEVLIFVARMASQHPLVWIHATFDRPMDTDIIPELQEFISAVSRLT
ncbi:hypothetical protein C8R43DRAFT_953995 [Mycena crocata]|nr:hypothetical protein C8R43DRAFT_953995 [Mycena crocata]